VHYYDDEVYEVDSRELESLTRRLVAGWWHAASDEPDLSYRGVWLPDLLTVGKRLRVRLEVIERLGIIDRVLHEVKPDQLRLLSGASLAEQVARLVARTRGLGCAASRARPGHSSWRGPMRLSFRERSDQPPAAPPSAAAPLTSRRADGRRILFVTCRSRHHLLVDPLIEAVRSAGASPRLVAQSNEDPELAARVSDLSAAGVPTAYLMDYLPGYGGAPRQTVSAAVPARAPACRARSGAGGADVLAGRLALAGPPPIPGRLRGEPPDSPPVQEAAFRAVRALRPDALVVTSDRRLAERAMAFVARSFDIPSLLFSEPSSSGVT